VRLLSFGDKTIQWSHLYQAYQWDQSTNSLKLHERLTEEHFNLGYASRMRNHLAEDVLSKKMLHLLQVKQNTIFKSVHNNIFLCVRPTTLFQHKRKQKMKQV